MATERRGDNSNELGRQPATDLTASRATSADSSDSASIDVFESVVVATTLEPRVESPSNIPGEGRPFPGRTEGESAPRTLAPEVTPSDALTDQFGLDLEQDGGQQGLTAGRGLDLPEAPAAVDLLDREATGPLDPGLDLSNLGGSTTLDGRTHDAYEGATQEAPATGPADPAGMISDGKPQRGSPYTTDADSDTSDAEAAVDALIAGMQAGTRHNPYTVIQEEVVGSVVDVPVADAAEAREVAAEDSKSNAEIKDEQWDHVGEDVPAGGHKEGDSLVDRVGSSGWLESWKGLFKDELPPDHPDYGGGGGEVSPGSQTDGSIQDSLLINLGGQRGGDIDPQDDVEPATSGERLYEPVDSVVDPGEDHYASSFEADRSMLGGPMDHVAPELEGGE